MAKSVISWDVGTRNLSYAYLDECGEILSWGMIDLYSNQASTACSKLFDVLESPAYAWMCTSDADIVIESQPKSGVVKCVSIALQMYFLARCTPPKHVLFFKPNARLQVIERYWKEMPRAGSRNRKAIALRTAKHILNDTTENNRGYLSFFEGHNYKQRTDLADSLTQGIRFLQLYGSPDLVNGIPHVPGHQVDVLGLNTLENVCPMNVRDNYCILDDDEEENEPPVPTMLSE